ncbi:MAG: hypothetical protein KGO94_12895 [Alphaproteobacteria bacterium]|nr:hypothetical protein [Alphaproteobacteria bacterium]
MKFLPQRFGIASFGNGGFRFGEHSHVGHLLVLPSGMRAWDGVDFASVLAERENIDFVILGTGAAMVRPDKAVLEVFASHGLPLDFMSTSSAVHIFNQVLEEGRRVAAGFIAVL